MRATFRRLFLDHTFTMALTRWALCPDAAKTTHPRMTADCGELKWDPTAPEATRAPTETHASVATSTRVQTLDVKPKDSDDNDLWESSGDSDYNEVTPML